MRGRGKAAGKEIHTGVNSPTGTAAETTPSKTCSRRHQPPTPHLTSRRLNFHGSKDVLESLTPSLPGSETARARGAARCWRGRRGRGTRTTAPAPPPPGQQQIFVPPAEGCVWRGGPVASALPNPSLPQTCPQPLLLSRGLDDPLHAPRSWLLPSLGPAPGPRPAPPPPDFLPHLTYPLSGAGLHLSLRHVGPRLEPQRLPARWRRHLSGPRPPPTLQARPPRGSGFPGPGRAWRGERGGGGCRARGRRSRAPTGARVGSRACPGTGGPGLGGLMASKGPRK